MINLSKQILKNKLVFLSGLNFRRNLFFDDNDALNHLGKL